MLLLLLPSVATSLRACSRVHPRRVNRSLWRPTLFDVLFLCVRVVCTSVVCSPQDLNRHGKTEEQLAQEAIEENQRISMEFYLKEQQKLNNP